MKPSAKVRRLCLRFMNNMGSGLVVGLGSGSIYRIIQIYVPDLPSGEGRVTIGVGGVGSIPSEIECQVRVSPSYVA